MPDAGFAAAPGFRDLPAMQPEVSAPGMYLHAASGQEAPPWMQQDFAQFAPAPTHATRDVSFEPAFDSDDLADFQPGHGNMHGMQPKLESPGLADFLPGPSTRDIPYYGNDSPEDDLF